MRLKRLDSDPHWAERVDPYPDFHWTNADPNETLETVKKHSTIGKHSKPLVLTYVLTFPVIIGGSSRSIVMMAVGLASPARVLFAFPLHISRVRWSPVFSSAGSWTVWESLLLLVLLGGCSTFPLCSESEHCLSCRPSTSLIDIRYT